MTPRAVRTRGLILIRFSKDEFEGGAEHAASYATKYLVKHPEQGFPSWVLDYKGQIRRYTTSMGFWGTPPRKPAVKRGPTLEEIATKKAPPMPKPHVPTCFCPVCRGEVPRSRAKSGSRLSTIRERMTRCGERAVVMAVLTTRGADGTLGEHYEYRFQLSFSMKEFLAQHDGKADDRRAVSLSAEEYHRLVARTGGWRAA